MKINNTSVKTFICMIITFALITGFVQIEGKRKWQKLFNGKDLKGWKQLGGTAKFYVENGQIVGESKLGSPSSFLATEKLYSNFILELDLKGDTAMNSGIQFRSNSLKDYKDGLVHGYQAEIDPTKRAWSGGIYDEGRRGWLKDLKDNEAGRKAYKNGEWNHYRIVAIGDSLSIWVNGIQTATLKDSMTPTGFIAIQVHHTENKRPMEIRCRNIRIQEMD